MVYEIPAPGYPWLFPALAAGGVLCQLLALFLPSKWLLALGLAMIMASAYAERDLTLAVGSLLAAICICLMK